MRAVVLKEPRKIEMMDVHKPSPREDEVIIKVGAVGICGSDVRYFLGENPWALHTLGKDMKEDESFILGHEVAGKVTEVGKWTGESKLEERVGVIAFKGCGECYYCRRNLPNLCEKTLHIGHDRRWGEVKYPPGGYADYMQIWTDKIHPIPESVSFREATQLDGLAVSVHANDRGDVSPGDTVVVIGTSAIGLMLLQVAKVRGATKTIALDTWNLPLELAKKLGADHVINVEENNDIVEEIKKLTEEIGANVVFDTVGSAETTEKGLKCLGRKGKFVSLAVTDQEIKMKLSDIIGGEKMLTCSANNLYEDYSIAVDLLSSGKVKVKPFITHTMKLDEYKEAFDMLLNKKEHDVIKIVLTP